MGEPTAPFHASFNKGELSAFVSRFATTSPRRSNLNRDLGPVEIVSQWILASPESFTVASASANTDGWRFEFAAGKIHASGHDVATIRTQFDMSEATDIPGTQRLVSLDAYRGAIMISLISHGFGFSAFQGHPYLGFLAEQTEHVPWDGCVYWDLIQPAFMFMVGVAMPFAYAKRVALNESRGTMLRHVLRRCFNLVLIAAVFTSIHAGYPTFTLVNVLPQIAFGYLMTFFVLQKSFATQGITALLILFVYTIIWMWYPGNGEGGPWAMGNENMGGDFEKWVMGDYNAGFWVSLNAIPSTATIIAGAMCGKLLASDRTSSNIMTTLLIAAVVLIIAGWTLGHWIPMVKRIMTASFTVYSTGWAILFLLFFYWIIDVIGCQRWAFFLVVVGTNSIAAYVVFQLFRGWIDRSLLVFTDPIVTRLGAYGDVFQAMMVLLAQWYILYFCYKKRVFFKA